MFYTTKYTSPAGVYTLASDGISLIAVCLCGQKYFEHSIPKNSNCCGSAADLDIFYKTKNWLDRYFAGEKPQISELPLAPIGSEFQQKVWAILNEIPYGELTTYGEIAKKIGIKSGQAVGGAVGHNPISIIIPCHRVVGANGNLTGYAGGLDVKIKLLELEGVDIRHCVVKKYNSSGSAAGDKYGNTSSFAFED